MRILSSGSRETDIIPLISRYFLLLCLAKSIEKFRALGKEVDDTVYFNLNDLPKVADYLREMERVLTIKLSIKYDTKVAG